MYKSERTVAAIVVGLAIGCGGSAPVQPGTGTAAHPTGGDAALEGAAETEMGELNAGGESGRTVAGGAGSGPGCVDECVEHACEGLTLRRCGEFDDDPCLELGPETSCASSDPCTLSACDVSVGCVEAPRLCSSPPSAACSGSNTLVTYSNIGTCSGGTCEYASTEYSCAKGCAGGACIDACDNVVCSVDPPTCIDATTLRTASYAECILPAGSCHSVTANTSCLGACSFGACTELGTWTSLSGTLAPSARVNHVAVWTGTEMIVWGGIDGSGMGLSDGARYNPKTDSWTPMSATSAPPSGKYATYAGVWSGSELIVWGGPNGNDGGRYSPETDSWQSMTSLGAPAPRVNHRAVWVDSSMIVWGGSNPQSAQYFGDGARYDPDLDSWSPLNGANEPSGRNSHMALSVGESKMLIVGGCDSTGCNLGDGGVYDASNDTWTPLSIFSAPSLGTNEPVGVWSGSEALIWGLEHGYAFSPSSNAWSFFFNNIEPSRDFATVIWNGSWNSEATQMTGGSRAIVWGGWANSLLSTGWVYERGTNKWAPTKAGGAPSARRGHTAVWTGSEMIVWGGNIASNGSISPVQTGARLHF